MSEPRGQCAKYIREHYPAAPILVNMESINLWYQIDFFADGPYKDTFGDGPGEPYTGKRQIFGLLKTGEVVYCEQE